MCNMSGHSKWSTIKRQKEVNDQARGKLFSKLSKAISIAVKSGGGPNSDSNLKLRGAMDAARTSNMPKENIKRAIERASESSSQLVEVVYEGFGAQNVGIIVEAATDNKNRTAQEVKYAFERNGGNMAGPGAVSYNFTKKGYMLVKKAADVQEQMLVLIDLGVLDVQDSSEGLNVYTVPTELFSVKQKIEDKGFMVLESEIIQEPVVPVKIESESDVQRIYKLLDALDNLDDVQKVFSSADIK